MSTLKVNNIVAYSGTHVSGTFSGVFSGSFNSNRIDALEAFSSSLDNTFATDLVVNSLSGAFNSFTAALDNTYATDAQLLPILQATRSLELLSGSMIGVTNGLMSFSSSQLAVNLTLSTVTGSLIGITNGLMAFTAALDSTYATDAQLYQLYQATQSLELTTGSLIGITNGLMAFTAALDSTYATDAQLYQLYAETASIKAEIGGIEAYTASLKGAAIVSSSQQVQNYFAFALTSSNNSFFGESTFTNKVTHTNGYVVLSQVSASLNFVDDTAAAAGGVPLGGLYRNGNFIVIRIV